MKTISFVIPVFNEEKGIGKIFKALNGFILPLNLKLDKVIFVNENSYEEY